MKFPSKRFKKPESVSLLEHTRLRNIAISRRKLDLPVERIISAVTSLDLKTIPLESVEILQRMIPTEQEVSNHRTFYNEEIDFIVLKLKSSPENPAPPTPSNEPEAPAKPE
ncbi:formin-like protein [Diaphorina citri]|uniref:Formin-like protein n=1 Tax=Diaphorina citri TaxID=121845 RepID=A0A3Q0JMS8_DIACI|nr:formin-like protein [Diaphorina citri]